MKKLTTAFVVTLVLASLTHSFSNPLQQVAEDQRPPALDAPPPETVDGPIIQLSLLLDTSNSMDGLIDQARSRLWKIVNEVGKARVDGQIPQLQVALFQYGNDDLSRNEDYVQLRCPFTTDLDIISEQLFSLSTNGGQEYCGAVLRESLNRLTWQGTSNDNVLRIIVIAGNEPFNQGTEPYEEWTANAKNRNVRINTIFCGNIDEGRKTLWADAANRSGGEYAAIDQNKTEVSIPTPFDDVIQKLNDALNGTYIGYGRHGKIAESRQMEQDSSNQALSPNAFYARAATKASSNYRTNSWDLVSAVEDGNITIEKVRMTDLPHDLAKLTRKELKTHIKELSAERKRIQDELTKASEKRSKFISKAKQESAQSEGKDLDDAMIESIRKQASSEGFEF